MKIFDPATIHLYKPPLNSHKGQNGKLLVIGGSKFFHSSIFWSADIASRIIDIVHFTSPANENNELVRRKIKEKFWSGIVVDWADVENYIEEDDCVLIGPGMIRDSEFSEHSENSENRISSENQTAGVSENPALRPSESLTFRHSEILPFSEILNKAAKSDETSVIVNMLLRKYPGKRWVIDGGGLQEVAPGLITESCILTPHRKEFLNLLSKSSRGPDDHRGRGDLVGIATSSRRDVGTPRNDEISLSKKLDNCTILLKGQIDTVCQGNRCIEIRGGNPGMTKGGTGDVLAGLVAALYCKNDPWTAATVGSWVNKTAGDELNKKVGPYFNAADLVEEVPMVLAKLSGQV